MKKIFVSVFDCKPGVQIAEDIFNEYGAVVISDGMVLDEFIIDRIKKLGLVRIKVYDNDGGMIRVSDSELFKAQYNENLNSVKSVLHDISIGKKLDTQRVIQTTSSILAKINENRDIVSCITEMRATGEYLYTHSVNVSLLSMLIGKWLRFDYKRLKSLVTAGFLHDIGKSKISSEILKKPGSLNEEEFAEIKKHPTYGLKIAEGIPDLNDDVLKGILMHHEREDGSGYPFGLKGDKIHQFAKIVAVADIYDAMTSDRVYRERVSPFDVMESIERDNFGILDHSITSVFLKNIASYYIGEYVRLSTGNIGEIVYINPYNISKPVVRTENSYIDLSVQRNISITELVN